MPKENGEWLEAQSAESQIEGIEDEQGRIRLSGLLSAILAFDADPSDESRYEFVQEIIESIIVRERLTLMEKDLALVEILDGIPQVAAEDAAAAAVSIELAKYFHGLLKYATNLSVDVEYGMLDMAVYDALEAFGFEDSMRRFCGKDYDRLCAMVDNALDFRSIEKIVNLSALFSEDSMKEFRETVLSLKTELTPERLAQMKAVVAAGDPAWQALRETVAETAVENALRQDAKDLREAKPEEGRDALEGGE